VNALSPPPAPVGLLAELTHRCPLRCPYCSNPTQLDGRASELSTEEWKRVLSEAAALGVIHVHLSGGEPASRRDLVDIVAHCASLGLYSNLITSGIGVTEALVQKLADAGLDHVQLSIQDSDAASADRIAGYEGASARKRLVAGWVTAAGLPLTVNAVIHRANAERVEDLVRLAMALGARRVEIAHTQYYGWALPNRAALMPTREQTRDAIAVMRRLRDELAGAIVIDHVAPDYYSKTPKACMGGWARKTLNVTPSGKALPCHAAETIPGLDFWSVREHGLAEIWSSSPAFEAYRGTSWMKEPCRGCDRREADFGGCRCQALAIAGDAAATDPVCHLSPLHHRMAELASEGADASAPIDYLYRESPR
jgi:pyrroloquinoline quinone biosynthesis protein E